MVRPAIRGSGTGRPASSDHIVATSSTLRAIGPTVSSVGQSGKTPSVGMSPHSDFNPTTSHAADGSRTEQPVSVPSARSHNPAASAAAEPLEEPPVVRPGRVGLWHMPCHWLSPSTPQANSVRLVLPTRIAPASSNRCAATAVRVGTWSAYMPEP